MKKVKSIIEFKDISLRFKSKKIFEKFNFSIKPKQKIVIFGKSGTGKSTFINLILGFKQPDSGQIFFNGQEITSDSIWKIRNQIAYVDQDVMMGEGIVQDVIDDYFSFTANANQEISPVIVKKLLAEFDLNQELLTKEIDHLSGGERQRLALVVALLLKRKVMVLDEVTSALDPISKDLVIKKLLKNKQQTLIIITHDKEWRQESGVKVFDFKEKKWVQ